MTKTRNQGKNQQEEGRRSGSDAEVSDGQQSQGGCIQPVRKLIDKYSTPRKGSAYSARTPAATASTSRRMGPPSSAARSAHRPGATSVLRVNNNELHRQLQFQESKEKRESDPVEVYCRIKPLEENCGSCIQVLDDTSLALIPPETSVAFRLGTAKESHYAFKRVFGSDACQKQIFDEIALPLVKDFLKGKNALLFAYGVTSSGKTYTMSGNIDDCGIMPRCLDVIFNSISKKRASKYVFKPDRMNGFEAQSKADAMLDRQKEMYEKQRETTKTPRRNGKAPLSEYGMEQYRHRIKDETTLEVVNEDSLYSVFVTYVEIYNNNVYDLLDESPIDMKKSAAANLQQRMLREDGSKNVYVHQVTEVEVESPEEAFGVYHRGQRRRRMAHTALNTESSRSHSIFNIRLVQAPLDSEGEEVAEDKKLIHVSQLSLVDLAGSERHTRTQATGDRLKEAGNINNSLMTLRKCMDILRENQKFEANRVVPFRESKLTHFLKNYFDGEGRVRMILCVNPKNEDYDENLHVMTFAELTQEVQIVRPQEKKLDPMTPGRAKASEYYKGSKQYLVDANIIEEHQLPRSDVQMVFGLGIPIPMCTISKSTEKELLTTLRKALELRVKGKDELRNFISEKRQSFRLRLMSVERDIQSLRSESTTYRLHIDKLTTEKEKLDNVLRATLFEKGDLEIKNKDQEDKLRALEDELLTCKMEIRQRDLAHHKEKETLKEDMDIQRELDAIKQERVLQQEKAKLQAEYKTKEKTIKAVRQLVSNDGRGSRHSRSIIALDLSTTTSSESDVPSGTSGKADSRTTRSRVLSTPLLHESISVQVNPPSTTRRNALVSSHPSRFGRARSTDGDVWVEHTDRAVVYKPKTVFQPTMKKKISVSKLSSADDLKGATKYGLLTQEQDSDGDIQTKLYKGEINATITGGANMVWQDVEALKQLSPTGSPSTRKRSSESPGPHRTRRSRIGMGDV